MKDQEILMLQKQIDKLDAEDFDLLAWKTGAIILLERIFGSGNQKIKQLDKIKYDQSSWALREASGSKNMMNTCKKQGKEIIEIAIDELEQLGLPKDMEEAEHSPFKSVIVQSLENELKISQYREVVRIIHTDKQLSDKKNELIDTLNDCGHDVAENILTTILLSDQTKKYL